VLPLVPVLMSKLEFQWHPTLKRTHGKIKELCLVLPYVFVITKDCPGTLALVVCPSRS
jgi:hypothetical protein